MPIPSPSPLTVPAVAEKTFPHLWISEFRAVSPDSSSGSVKFKVTPYDDVSDEIADDDHSTSFSVPLWELVAEVPEAALAMQAVFDAYPAIRAWHEARLAAAAAAAAENPDPV